MVSRNSIVKTRRRSFDVRSTLLVLIVAVIATVLVVLRQPLATPRIESTQAYVAEFQTREIPVPDVPVAAGTLVRDIPVRFEKFPEHQLPAGTVHDLAPFRDKVTLVGLPGGFPLLETNLGQVEDVSSGVVGRIPPGMRAMSVKVDATSSVEGWARSGSIVDVLLVEKNRTLVIAERVRVLSAERSTSPVEIDSAAQIPSTVTLLVTQEQCLAINTAIPLGKIAFALRSGRDGESWRSTEFSSDDLATEHDTKREAKITGMVKFKDGGKEQQFALIDNSWVPADDAPSAFRLNNDRAALR